MKNIIFAILFILVGTNAWALNAPRSLTASAVSASQINLSFVDRAREETGYIIERSLSSSSTSFSEIARTNQNIVTYNNVGLAANTTYYYRVRAYRVRSSSRIVYSEYTAIASARTLSGTPTNASCPLPASLGGGSIAHDQTVRAFQASSVSSGSTCVSETRVCNNGNLSGSYLHLNCTVQSPSYTYSYVVGNFGACSATACGTSGTQTRSVVCQRNDGVAVADSYCSGTKPATSQPCSAPACTSASCPLPASLGGGSIAHNQSVSAFQALSVPNGSTCVSESRVCNNGNLSGSYLYSSCSVSNPPSTTGGIVIDMSYVNQLSAQYTRFKNMVDGVVNGGGRPYGFAGADAAYMYRITGQSQYCTLAITIAEEQVTAAEAAINGGGRPAVSGDSYLEVGPMIQDVALAYDWCANQMNSVQRTRWANYANQAIHNVWNYNTATWGGRSYPWSGWSVNNPGNNYYYSFTNATMLWALASRNQYYVDFLRNNKFAALRTYFAQLAGGGSREGTGYGTAHMNLFSVYKIWRDSTGEDLANASTHVTDTIRYWAHAIVPTRDRFAPIGDQARDSSAMLFDYHRRLVLEARALSTNEADRALGSFVLNNMSIQIPSQRFGYRHDLYPAGTSSGLPNEGLIHHGVGTGHIFARTSWNTDATWMSFVAGPYTESHAHQDQGSFSIYKNSWVAVTPNIASHSGINQGTDIHNLVRFVRGGTTIRQVSHDNITAANTSTFSFLSRNNATGEFTAEANLTPAYNGNTAIQSWRRNIGFVNKAATGQRVINITDNFQVTSDTQAIFQVHTVAAPSVSGNIVSAGNMRMTVIAPSSPSISVVNMSGTGDFSGGYRVEVRGPAGTGQIQVEIAP